MNETNAVWTWAERGVVALALVVVLVGTYNTPGSVNVTSRLATVEGLIHRDTYRMDGGIFDSIDKVYIDGYHYSSKPPLFPTLMALEYGVLHHALGMDIRPEDGRPAVVRALCLSWIGLPFVLSVACVLVMLRWFVADPRARLFALVAYAFGTPALGFAVTINNHVPAAALTAASAMTALGLVHGKLRPTPVAFAAAGAFAALLPTFDLPGMFFSAAVGLYLLRYHPRQTLTWFLAGALPVLIAHFYLTWLISGSLLPFYVRKELYVYPGSYWLEPQLIDALDEPKWQYLANLTIGRKGLFLMFPVLAVGMAGAVRAAFRSHSAPRWERVAYAALVVFWIAFYTATTNNYGGAAYGVRWFVFFVPPLALLVGCALDGLRSRWAWAGLMLLLIVSIYSAWENLRLPWTLNQEWPTLFLGNVVS